MPGPHGFSPDDGKVDFFRQTSQATVGLTKARSGAGVRAASGKECGPGGGACGRQVTEGAGEGFPSGEGGWGGWGEVNPLNHRVCFENEIELTGKRGKNSAVVTDGVADSLGGLTTQGQGPPVNPEILAGGGSLIHGRGGRARRMRIQVLALKKE